MVNSSQTAQRILDGLNKNQREAVETIEGPLLILAGPGSGKTRVITQRIAYLTRVVGVSPYRIGAVTFTNKAAREMRARLTPLLGPAADHVTAKTFHTFCAQVLRQEGEAIGVKRDFAIYDDSDQMSLMKRVMKELELDPKRYAPRAILSAISSAKSQLLGFEGLSYKSGSYFEEIVVRAYEHYEGLLQQCSALDFDDLLLKTYLLFDRMPEVAKKYQERYVHFMVDEFQDTNVAQYAIAKQVAYSYSNICVVGDPDQSIYTWRNADIRNILSFQDDYPNAKVIALEENYRSTQTILDAAKSLIAVNTQRVDKDLWTQNGEGVPIVVSEGYNETEEAQFVVKEIQSLTRGSKPRYKLGDIAVMYRVNAQSRALEESCRRYGMPYQVVGGQKFYQRQEVKDVTAYLRLVVNPNDDVSLERVINTPTRGIGQRTMDELTRLARTANMSMFAAINSLASGVTEESGESGTAITNPFPARSLRALTDFHDLIKSLQAEREASDILDLIDSVVDRTGYKTYLMDQSDRGEERLENIQEFKASARDFLAFGRDEALTAFLESVSLVADIDSMEEKPDAITLITLHQAKGLEFPVVFMVGMEEGLLPHIRSMDDPTQLEEERRLCYVGVTRARERLYLCRSFRRGFRGGSEPSIPSRFLMDIPPKLITAPVQSQPKSKTIKSAAWTPGARRARQVEPSVGNGRGSKTSVVGPAKNPRPTPAPALPHFSTGDKVKHSKFGDGIVVECKASHEDFEVTVAFKDGAGIKRLMQGLAHLEKVE
ncbi:MAG: UvrD-helicase domain-containing protein [Chloroflexi bacterium]|nr:UvrD-helicase domain-containing protein [Chloroflexota bacterium]